MKPKGSEKDAQGGGGGRRVGRLFLSEEQAKSREKEAQGERKGGSREGSVSWAGPHCRLEKAKDQNRRGALKAGSAREAKRKPTEAKCKPK